MAALSWRLATRILVRLAGALPLCVAMLGATARPVAGQVAILLPGEFVGRRQWPRTEPAWFGLYITAGGFELRSTGVLIDTVANACAGTAVRVSVNRTSVPLLLVRGSTAFRDGPVDSAFSGHRFLYPGESLSLRLGEAWYGLEALGRAFSRYGETAFGDYSLHLARRAGAQTVSQTIYRIHLLTLDNPPQLRWAGDLDGDGRMDLFLELPAGGYSDRFVLFLSSTARAGQLVSDVADFTRGDC